MASEDAARRNRPHRCRASGGEPVRRGRATAQAQPYHAARRSRSHPEPYSREAATHSQACSRATICIWWYAAPSVLDRSGQLNRMRYRSVGRTDVQLSEIGFGCGGTAGLMVRGTPREQVEAGARALGLGINYFDNAPDYGDRVAERNLGRVLQELGARPYVTTKVEIRNENLDEIADHVVR